MPLTIEKAQRWAEEYLDADEYETLFGKVEEDKKVVGFSISPLAIRKLELLAEKMSLTKSQVIEKIIMEKEEG